MDLLWRCLELSKACSKRHPKIEFINCLQFYNWHPKANEEGHPGSLKNLCGRFVSMCIAFALEDATFLFFLIHLSVDSFSFNFCP